MTDMEAAEQIESLWAKLCDRQVMAIDMGQFYKASRLNCIMADYLSRWLKIYHDNLTSTQLTNQRALIEATGHNKLNSNNSSHDVVLTDAIVFVVREMMRLLRLNALLYYAYDEVYNFVEDGITSSNLHNWPVYQMKILHNKCIYLLRKSRLPFLDANIREIPIVCMGNEGNLPKFLSSLINPIVNKTNAIHISALAFVKIARGISLANIYRCLIEISIYAGHKNLSHVLYRIMIEKIHFDSIKFRLRLFNSINCSIERMRHDDDEDDNDDDDDDDDNDEKKNDNQEKLSTVSNTKKSDLLISMAPNSVMDEDISERSRLRRRKKHLLEHIDKSCFKFSCRLCSQMLNFNATMSDECSKCRQTLYFCSFTFETISVVDLSLDFDLSEAKEILKENVRLHLKNLIVTLPGQNDNPLPDQQEALSATGYRASAEEEYIQSVRAKTVTETTINSKSGRVVERMTLNIDGDDVQVDNSSSSPPIEPPYESLNYQQTDYEMRFDDLFDTAEQKIKLFYCMSKFKSNSEWRIQAETDLTESFKLLTYHFMETSVAKSYHSEIQNGNNNSKSILRSPITIGNHNREMIKLINYNDVIIMEPSIADQPFNVNRSISNNVSILLKTNNFVSVSWCHMGCQAIFDRRIVEILDSESRLSNSSNEQVKSGQVLPCPICKSDLITL